MSELMNIKNSERGFRRQLLTTVSAVAASSPICSPCTRRRQPMATPTVQRSGLSSAVRRRTHQPGQGAVYHYAPDFLSKFSTSSILQQKLTPTEAQSPSPFSFGEEGKISFQPDDSDWVFQASVRYGRSSNKKDVHHQTDKVHYQSFQSGRPVPNGGRWRIPPNMLTQENFVDTMANHDERHAIMDFTVGKDVGLGLFGRGGSSTFNIGVRIAQFSSRASVDMRARPDAHWKYYPSAGAPTRFNRWPIFPHLSRHRDCNAQLPRHRALAVMDQHQRRLRAMRRMARFWSIGAPTSRCCLDGKKPMCIIRDMGVTGQNLASHSTTTPILFMPIRTRMVIA